MASVRSHETLQNFNWSYQTGFLEALSEHLDTLTKVYLKAQCVKLYWYFKQAYLILTAIGELMAMSGATPKHLFFLNLTDSLVEDEEQVKHWQCDRH